MSRPLYSAGNLVAVIKRPLITCDTRQDQPITTFAPQTVIFARGGQPALSYHGRADRGSTNINFSWGPSIATTRSSSSICTGAASQLASGESKLDVLMSRTEVPAKETSYICKMLRIPVDRRRQVRTATRPCMHSPAFLSCMCMLGDLPAVRLAGSAGQNELLQMFE